MITSKEIERFIDNIYIETFNSILVITIFVLTLIDPIRIHRLYNYSTIYKVIWCILFLWLVSLRVYRFYLNFRKIRSRMRSSTFVKASKYYSNALSEISLQYYDKNEKKYTYEKAELGNLETIINLAHEAWDIDVNGKKIRSLQERREYISFLFKLNNNIFSIIKMEDDAIGYVSVIPMKDTKHFAGLKSQYDLKRSDIVTKGTSQIVYLQAVYKKLEFRDTEFSYKILISCLINRIAETIESPLNSVLYAEQFTEDGEYLLKKMGFQKNYRRSKSKIPKLIWQLNMDYSDIEENFKERKNALLTIKCIRQLFQKNKNESSNKSLPVPNTA